MNHATTDSKWALLFSAAWLASFFSLVLSLLVSGLFESNTAVHGLIFEVDRDSGRKVIAEVSPQSASSAVALKLGDVLTAKSTRDLTSVVRGPGGVLALEVDRDGQRLSLEVLLAEAPKQTLRFIFDFYHAAMGLLCLVAAAVIGLGSRRNLAFRWLALMLVAWAFQSELAAGSLIYSLSNLVGATAVALAPVFMIRFWLAFAAQHNVPMGSVWTYWTRLAECLAGIVIAMALLGELMFWSIGNPSYWKELAALSTALGGSEASRQIGVVSGVIGFGGCVVMPGFILYRARSKTLNSAAWMSLALLGFFIAPLGHFIGKALMAVAETSEPLRQLITESWLYATMPIPVICLLAFTTVALKRRVVSIEFAINATAVYVATGTALIVVFVALKASIESVGRLDGGVQELLLSATVAGLAFVSKQLKGAAEKIIKRLFFLDFNRREAALRQFESKLSYFRTQEALHSEALRAVAEFCHGARLARFVWDGAAYVNAEENQVLPADHELPLALRACGGFVVGEDLRSSDLSTVRLAIPAYHRSDLSFIVVVYESPDLPVFRPDDLNLIQSFVSRWCTEQALMQLDQCRAGLSPARLSSR